MSTLHEALAPRIAPVILANVTTRYPYHDSRLVRKGETPCDPTVVHPAFGNSFDWHSSVHSHWTAVQLLNHFAALGSAAPTERAMLQTAVAENLDPANIAAEIAYLTTHPSYERPYGWAWAMLLAAAAQNADDARIRERAPQLATMAWRISETAVAWLNVLSEPIRHGVHSNTAFALGLMLDAARTLGLEALPGTIADRARAWFGSDRAWPEQWERSGNDFLSPGLAQADLMRRILPRHSFALWWSGFLPALSTESRILSVVEVPDVVDGQIVHLHGLNLSRAGMIARIAHTLHEPALLEHAHRLYRASVEQAVFGDYLATHWLATFAWDAAMSIDRACEK
ncbi:MAG: DUF2891 family protein [Vulcanimicrobiaceae bacterium]